MSSSWMWWVAAGLAGCATGPQPASEAPERPSPTTAHAPTGVPVAISAHCGVRGVRIKGQLWLATPPLGGHNPPPGWGENETHGVFVVTTPGRAVFHGDGGQVARFRQAAEGTRDPGADCE